jgi:micrococcal nuclease
VCNTSYRTEGETNNKEEDRIMYEYKATVDRWVDGDTVDVHIDLGFDVVLRDQRVRLYGVNTPETRTRDLAEKARGLAAKEYVNQMAPVGSEITLVTKTYDAKGKFGRILGEIVVTQEHGTYNINQCLINEGHATEYYGGKR